MPETQAPDVVKVFGILGSESLAEMEVDDIQSKIVDERNEVLDVHEPTPIVGIRQVRKAAQFDHGSDAQLPYELQVCGVVRGRIIAYGCFKHDISIVVD